MKLPTLKIPFLAQIKQIFICLLAMYAILREVIPLQFIVASNLLSYFFFLGGFALIAADMLDSGFRFPAKNMLWLVAFLGICVLTTLLNYRYGLVSNVKAVCWVTLFFLLLYPYGARIGSGDRKALAPLFYTVITTVALLMVVSLPMYFFNVDYTYYNNNSMGIISNQGFSSYYCRLWGVFKDANRAAVYSFVALLMALYMLVKEKNVVVKVLMALVTALIFCYIVLTLSRTAQLAIFVVCGWAAFYTAVSRLNTAKWKRALVGIIACVVSVVLCYGLFEAAVFALPYAKRAVAKPDSSVGEAVHVLYDDMYRLSGVNILQGYVPKEDPQKQNPVVQESQPAETTPTVPVTEPVETVPGTEPVETVPGTEPVETVPTTESTAPAETTPPATESKDPGLDELKRGDEKDDISNGRFERWSDGIRIFLKAPILGASPRGMYAFAAEHLPETYAGIYGREVHNSFLDVLAGTGIVGFAVMMAFLCITAWSILKTAFTERFSGNVLLFSCALLVLICFGALTSDLFFYMTFGCTMFWLAMGAINGQKKQQTDK